MRRSLTRTTLVSLAIIGISSTAGLQASDTRTFMNLSDYDWTVSQDVKGANFSTLKWTVNGKVVATPDDKIVLPSGSLSTVTFKPGSAKFSLLFDLNSSDTKQGVIQVQAAYPASGIFAPKRAPVRLSFITPDSALVKLNQPLTGDLTFAPTPKAAPATKVKKGMFRILNSTTTGAWTIASAASTKGSLAVVIGTTDKDSAADLKATPATPIPSTKTVYLRYQTDASGNCTQDFTITGPASSYKVHLETVPGADWPSDLKLTQTTLKGTGASWLFDTRFSMDRFLEIEDPDAEADFGDGIE